MSDQALILIIGSIVTGLTTLITLVFTLTERSRNNAQRLAEKEQQVALQIYREKLASDLEITKLAAAEVARKAEVIKLELLEATKIREAQIKNIGDAIKENTVMNKGRTRMLPMV